MSLVLALLTAVPAGAVPPGSLIPPQPVDAAFVTDNCGFDVLIEVEGKEGWIQFEDHARLFFPGERAVLSNLDSGTSVEVNISGPGKISETETPDGGLVITLEGRGNWLNMQPEAIWLTSGPFSMIFVIDANGNLVSQDEDLSQARIVDLCPALT